MKLFAGEAIGLRIFSLLLLPRQETQPRLVSPFLEYAIFARRVPPSFLCAMMLTAVPAGSLSTKRLSSVLFVRTLSSLFEIASHLNAESASEGLRWRISVALPLDGGGRLAAMDDDALREVS